jgi:amidohydrolase
VTTNDTALAEATLPAWKAMLGEANVIHVPPVMGGEDFSFFQRSVPGVMFWLGVGNRARGITGSLHTPQYDADEASLVVGVRAMCAAVFNYLDQKR